jgi:hypothetical protein
MHVQFLKKTCYSCAHAKGPRPGAEYLRKRNIPVVITDSFPLSFCRRSPFLTVVNPESCSERKSSSDFLATSASDFHHRSMMSMLHKLGPALDQVKAWQQAVNPAIDELRQIGPLLPQMMAQLRDSAQQIHELAQQQQRFEVAQLDLHSELQRLKSYLYCAADH